MTLINLANNSLLRSDSNEKLNRGQMQNMEENDIPVLFGDLVSTSVPLPDAACKDKSTDLFFSHSHWVLKKAKKVCYECPERIKCLDFALENKEDSGVWGGVIFRRGRPDENDINYVRSLGDPEILRKQMREQERQQLEEEKIKKKEEGKEKPSVTFVDVAPSVNHGIKPVVRRMKIESLKGGQGQSRYPMFPAYQPKHYRGDQDSP